MYDDRKLFEMLILEGAQAGLSWITVLKKRQFYQDAFDNFDYIKIANYDESKFNELLNNSNIIRNRRKINSAITNAKVFINIQNKYGSFSNYIWAFVNDRQIKNSYRSLSDIPAKTELSDKISKDLKKKGMSFVGSIIIYSFMQAVGMVNDHTTNCHRYNEITNLNK